MKRLGGSSEYYSMRDTLQFEDYSKFAAGSSMKCIIVKCGKNNS